MIEVNHRGYTIHYNENTDEWCASGANMFSHAKLTTVRGKIDQMLRAERQASSVPAFFIDADPFRGPQNPEPATVIEYVRERWDRDYKTGLNVMRGHTVAVMAGGIGMKDRKSRRDVNMESLMPANPEALAAYSNYLDIKHELQKLVVKARQAVAAVPRLTLEDIAELHRIAKAAKTEEE